MLTRGDVEDLDTVEDRSWDDHDVPAEPGDVAFTTGDWLGLLKPTGGPSIRSPRMWKRLSGMVAVISGIALVVVTFSTGRPVAEDAVNIETASATTEADSSTDPTNSTLALQASTSPDLELLASTEAAFLARFGGPAETTTTTTASTTTAARWSEPVIPPESEWIDAGHGVAVPDVLLRIRYCESTNNYQAAHTVSSARGAYQFLRRSWEWYGHAARYGAATADLAAPAQQDEAAVLTLRRDGTRPWLASWSCWGSTNLPNNYAAVRRPAQPTTTSTTDPTTSSTDTTESTTTTSTSSSTSASSTAPTTATTAASTVTSSSTSTTQAGSSTSGSTTSTSTSGSSSSTANSGAD